MKKVFIVVIFIFISVFIYFGGKQFLDYLNDLSILIDDAYTKSATVGTFGFKATPENLELVNSYLKVNTSFINEMSKEIHLENNIKNIHTLLNNCPSFKNYYSARLKLENAIFNGFHFLMDNAVYLSDNELEAFFNDNLSYLDKTFGITTLEKFKNIINSLSSLESKNINYCELIDDYTIYNPYGNSTVFRMKVGSSLNDFAYFSINAYHGYNTKNQQAPVIIFNAPGGMS